MNKCDKNLNLLDRKQVSTYITRRDWNNLRKIIKKEELSMSRFFYKIIHDVLSGDSDYEKVYEGLKDFSEGDKNDEEEEIKNEEEKRDDNVEKEGEEEIQEQVSSELKTTEEDINKEFEELEEGL